MAERHPTATLPRRTVRRLSRWAWIVPGSGCTCPFPRYADDCPRHRARHAAGNARIRTIASAAFVDGARVEAESINGWLQIRATTDDSIKGWALTMDGKDHPSGTQNPQESGVEALFVERGLEIDRLRHAYEGLRTGVGALVATTRCYKRPDSKLEPDPGPCGRCAACLARRAYYGTAE